MNNFPLFFKLYICIQSRTGINFFFLQIVCSQEQWQRNSRKLPAGGGGAEEPAASPPAAGGGGVSDSQRWPHHRHPFHGHRGSQELHRGALQGKRLQEQLQVTLTSHTDLSHWPHIDFSHWPLTLTSHIDLSHWPLTLTSHVDLSHWPLTLTCWLSMWEDWPGHDSEKFPHPVWTIKSKDGGVDDSND